MDKKRFRAMQNKLKFKDDFSNHYVVGAGFVFILFIALVLYRFIPIITHFFNL